MVWTYANENRSGWTTETYQSREKLEKHSAEAAMNLYRARQRQNQLWSLGSALGRADRSLTGNRNLRVDIGTQGNFTAGSLVTLQVDPNDSLTSPSTMMKVLGANYHELAHVWFGVGGFRVAEFQCWNILEDQRIESMAVAIYPSLAAYYRASYFGYVATDKADVGLVHVFAHGRKFLPKSHRAQARRLFKYPDKVEEVDDIIDQYRALGAMERTPDENQIKQIERLVMRLARVLFHDPVPQMHHDHAAKGSAPTPRVSPFQGDAKTQAEAAEGMKEDDATDAAEGGDGKSTDKGGDEAGKDATQKPAKAAKDKGKADAPGKDDQAADGQSGQGKPASSKPGPGDKSGEDTNGAGVAGEGEATGDKPGGGIGSGGDVPIVALDPEQWKFEAAEFKNEAAREKEVAVWDEEVQRDVVDMLEATKMREITASANVYRKGPATRAMVAAAEEFADAIRQLNADDVDPGWTPYQASGKLNVGRYMRGEDMDMVFDIWREDMNEEFRIDAGILLDVSGSMNGGIRDRSNTSTPVYGASSGAWIIRRAIESLGNNGTCSTICYGSRWDYAYPAGPVGNEWSWFMADGGTDIVNPMAEILTWLNELPAKSNKVLFILTDGMWSNAETAYALLQAAKEAGTTVVIIGWGYLPYVPLEAFDVNIEIQNEREYVQIAKQVCAVIYQKVQANLERR